LPVGRRSADRSLTYLCMMTRLVHTPVPDMRSAFFYTELLRATIAARGIFGTFLGPWSAGSSLVLLIRAAGDSHPAGSSYFVAGGMGAVTQAMATAAKTAGAEIRSGLEVIEVRVKDGA